MNYGLFSDEGLVDSDFWTFEEAQKALLERYSEEDELEILEVCPDHPEQPREGCEECNADGEEEEDEEGGEDL